MKDIIAYYGLKANQEKAMQAEAERDIAKLFGAAAPAPADKAHMILLLDASGSMSGLYEDVRDAVEYFLETFSGMSHCYLAFNDRLYRISNPKDYRSPTGNTAMYDAIIAGGRLTQAEVSHDNVICIIITDGQDNQSISRPSEAAEYITERRSRGWQFYAIILGGNGGGFISQSLQSIGIESIKSADIRQAVDKLERGIYGYLETGRLLLTE